MKRKTLLYALAPVMLGAGFLAVNVASAHGWFGGFGNLSPDEIATRQQTMFQHQAQVLGISVDEIKQAWAEGKNMQQLMDEKNINKDEVLARMKDARLQELKTQLQALVDKGVITRSQADTRLQVMQERIQNNTGHMGKGMHRGFMF